MSSGRKRASGDWREGGERREEGLALRTSSGHPLRRRFTFRSFARASDQLARECMRLHGARKHATAADPPAIINRPPHAAQQPRLWKALLDIVSPPPKHRIAPPPRPPTRRTHTHVHKSVGRRRGRQLRMSSRKGGGRCVGGCAQRRGACGRERKREREGKADCFPPRRTDQGTAGDRPFRRRGDAARLWGRSGSARRALQKGRSERTDDTGQLVDLALGTAESAELRGEERGSGHLHSGREVERGTGTYALLGELASLLVLHNREEERSGLAQVERGSESGRTLELRINSMTRLSYGAKPTTCERLRISLCSPLLPRSSRTDLADDRLDERATLGLLALAVARLVRLGEDSGRVTTVQAPGKVCGRVGASVSMLDSSRLRFAARCRCLRCARLHSAAGSLARARRPAATASARAL